MSPNNGKDGHETTTAAQKSSGGVAVATAHTNGCFLERLGFDVQVKLFSYLRAHDLSAVHRTNRHFWQAKRLQHAIVIYCAEQGKRGQQNAWCVDGGMITAVVFS
jgi:hypothetical protein